MRKWTLKIVNVVFLFSLVLLGSCSGREMPEERQVEAVSEPESEPTVNEDTVWMLEEVTLGTIPKWSLDTNFQYKGERVYFNLSLQPLDTPYKRTETWVRNDTTFAIHMQGPDFKLSASATSQNGQKLMDKILTKEDLATTDNSGYLVADSYTNFKFHGFHSAFNAILLSSFIGYPRTDRGVVEYIFLGMDGKIKKQLTNGYLFDLCDCEPTPSPNGKSFSFCNGILHSNYRLISVERDQSLAGIFQLGDRNSIAVYMFEGKPPYSNLKVLGSNGSVQKSFPFEGIIQEMSYSVLHCRLNNGKLVLFDDAQRQLFIFSAKNPTSPEIIPFDSFPELTEEAKSEGETFRLWSFRGEYELFYYNESFYLDETLTEY
ncbi:MAG: hypothetical protein ACFHU9_03145 [Fluviicola sp.]